MQDPLKERIIRSLEALSDERGYQVLDYVEFLESKYGERAAPTGIFAQLSDKVEDTMRAAKLPLDAITGTTRFFGGATKVMSGLASAAQAVVEETAKTLSTPAKPVAKTPAEGEKEKSAGEGEGKPTGQ